MIPELAGPPTKPGWYWVEGFDDVVCSIRRWPVEIDRNPQTGELGFFENARMEMQEAIDLWEIRRWWGPIEAP